MIFRLTDDQPDLEYHMVVTSQNAALEVYLIRQKGLKATNGVLVTRKSLL